jgi:hypothetical protein
LLDYIFMGNFEIFSHEIHYILGSTLSNFTADMLLRR